MKLVTLVLVFTVVLFVSVSVNAQRCQTVCFSDFDPVCGTTRRGRRTISCTFSNQCELNKHACHTRQSKCQMELLLDQLVIYIFNCSQDGLRLEAAARVQPEIRELARRIYNFLK